MPYDKEDLPLKRKSHLRLGGELAQLYLSGRSRMAQNAFVFGCIEPDWNPMTYLKGSRRHERLRGHNFFNAQRYMRRLANRLERREHWGLVSFYELGKLTHYIVDSFTHPHAGAFSGSLSEHLEYEDALQRYFLGCLERGERPCLDLEQNAPVFEMVLRAHEAYGQLPARKETDTLYALAVAAKAVERLYESVCAAPVRAVGETA